MTICIIFSCSRGYFFRYQLPGRIIVLVKVFSDVEEVSTDQSMVLKQKTFIWCATIYSDKAYSIDMNLYSVSYHKFCPFHSLSNCEPLCMKLATINFEPHSVELPFQSISNCETLCLHLEFSCYVFRTTQIEPEMEAFY